MTEASHTIRTASTKCGGQDATSDLTIEVLNCFRQMADYHATVNHILEVLSSVIHADRIYVLEQKRRLDGCVFEWCADGVPPRMAAIHKVSDDKLAGFVSQFKGCDIIFADTLDLLGVTDPRALAFFENYGVRSELIVPLRKGMRTVGCLGADNYSLRDDIDTRRLLETIAPFLATLISNHQLLDELEWSGTHDTLTELLNRRGVDRAASAYLASNPSGPFTLALVDLDDFKVTNDLYGHGAGDEALRMLAQSMREVFPEGTVLGRNGGDEMVVMLCGDAVNRADDLFSAFADKCVEFESAGHQVRLTTSIGYVTYPEQVSSAAEAYKLADVALYAVKLTGKGRAIRYTPEMILHQRSQLGFAPRDIAENVPGAIMVHRIGDDEGKILYANSEMVSLLGCDDLADFLAFTHSSYRGIIHPDDIARAHEEVAAQVGDRKPGAKFFVDYRVVTKDGSVREVAVNGHLVEAGDIGKAYYVLVIDREEHDFRHMR